MLSNSFTRIFGLIITNSFETLSCPQLPMTTSTSVPLNCNSRQPYLVITYYKLSHSSKDPILHKLLWASPPWKIKSLLTPLSLFLVRCLFTLLHYFRPYLMWNCMVVQSEICLAAFCLVDTPMGSDMVSTCRIPACHEGCPLSLLQNQSFILSVLRKLP